MSTSLLRIQCLCGSSASTISLPSSSLPLQTYLCHCNISRHISGCLCSSYARYPPLSQTPRPDLSALTAYRSSDILTRYFCTTCGTHMYLEYDDDGHFEIATGLLAGLAVDPDRPPMSIVKHVGHMWIEDTEDGGASDWISDLNGKSAERWMRGANSNDTGMLFARCYCGGVEFAISRPDSESCVHDGTADFPDLLVPYNSEKSAKNPDGKPWWLSNDGRRYTAGTCACDSCRRAAGFEIVEWAFVPAGNIMVPELRDASEPPIWRKYEVGREFGTGLLQSFSSSDRVFRRFCGGCGANIFWESYNRPYIIDVAVGILRAPEGARAETWLEWVTDRVSFCEEGANPGLVYDLTRGLEGWGKRLSLVSMIP
ncbi:DUF636 domain protein [Eremomyces bilateralis CBS 781.70]|uniref:DUF636 domain protein n=1 Tax=Eremomyces bilateralis CBS 781.70 TaxID=1392243 RepID=A0A6G1G495_9PEZI|nr:DUF636 domain protein [Eremomyces bilateralis CBS 781.70]KAF1812883.1 DUF636 domain protein [Eremomyces bilateralis CBS 781.70]